MDDCPKDFISALTDELLYQILSKLPIKEAGSTSVLSTKWRYLFARQPDLHFDDFSSLHPQDKTSFVSFVDRVLELGRNVNINKFSLKCGEHIWGVKVSSWISKVLSLGVSDLALHISPNHVNKSFLKCGEDILECDPSSWMSELIRLGVSVTDLSEHTSLVYNDPLPSEIFVDKELVSLKIGPERGPSFKLEDVSLPNLKTLDLESFTFEEDKMGFAKLLSGCTVLEELDLPNLCWNDWDSCYVSSRTLKRLMLCSASTSNINPRSVSFDTPNVVYFAYSDNIAYKYPVLNFDSLVEAQIDIKMTYKQRNYFSGLDSDEEIGTFSDAKVLLMGICNVKTLYISYNTLEGLNHRFTDECGDVCVCRRSEKNHSSLSQCPVKFLTVSYLGVPYDSDDDEWEMKTKMKNIKHFLKKMPNLEQLIISYNSPSGDQDLAEVSKQLQKLEKVASPKCINIQLIFDDISFSTVVPNSLSMELGQLLL